MFLAWQEIKKNKLRFTLITGILMLVSYLVFFLSGLATGLADLNREAVDKWEASAIILTEESDKSLYQSFMSTDELDDIDAEKTAVLGQLNAIASKNDIKQNISLFGIDKDEFLMPNVTEGRAFEKANEVIADDSMKDEGFQLGDSLTLSSSDEKLKIVGFTENARFNAAPVLYANLDTFHVVKFGEGAEQQKDQINGIVIGDDSFSNLTENDELMTIEIQSFIESLPGYTEQKLTLNFMIYFPLWDFINHRRDLLVCFDRTENQYVWSYEGSRDFQLLFITVCCGPNVYFSINRYGNRLWPHTRNRSIFTSSGSCVI